MYLELGDLYNMNLSQKYNLVKPALRRMKMSHGLTDALTEWQPVKQGARREESGWSFC